jgi:1,4-dihydroxy-6-naphthoate synthase
MEKTTLTLGHSPDPDDAFMFYALAKDLIPTHGFHFQHILQDIQKLNERATRGELDISAVSIHAYAYVSDKYALLPSGASMGDGDARGEAEILPRGNIEKENRRAGDDDQRVSGAAALARQAGEGI